MKSGSLELGTTLGWDRSQIHKIIPKISQLWGGVVLYNLAKKVFGLGFVDYPVSHQTFCLFLCFVPIPSYLTFCPNSFLQLSVFFLFNWSDQVPILQRRIVSIFCKQNLDLSYFLLRSINFATKKCSHFASRCCLTTIWNLCSIFRKWTTSCISFDKEKRATNHAVLVVQSLLLELKFNIII